MLSRSQRLNMSDATDVGEQERDVMADSTFYPSFPLIAPKLFGYKLLP